MGIDSVRAALQLLTGAGELTRARATEAASSLLETSGVGETSARASQLAEELIEAATANQQMMHDLVRTELERQFTRLGLVRGSDLDAARERIDTLEAEVARLRAQVAAETTPSEGDAPTAGRVSRTAIKNAARPATAAAKTSAPSASSTEATPVTTKAAATKRAATKSAAKKTVARKSAATKKAAKVAKKPTARATAGAKSGGKKSAAAGPKKATAKKAATGTKAAATRPAKKS